MWTKLALAGALLAVALGLVPMPVSPAPVQPDAPAPSQAMQTAVSEIKAVLSAYPAEKRALWSQLWEDAARVVTDPRVSKTIPDTPTLRAYQIEMLLIGWVVLGENAIGGNPALDKAVNEAFRPTLSLDERVVDDALLREYADLCRAVAWAGR